MQHLEMLGCMYSFEETYFLGPFIRITNAALARETDIALL